jgi:hypothetical protein
VNKISVIKVFIIIYPTVGDITMTVFNSNEANDFNNNRDIQLIHKKHILVMIIVIVISVLFILIPDRYQLLRDVKVEKGILDLREYPLNDHAVFELNGDYQFYWEEFVVPQVSVDADEETLTSHHHYLKVPGNWNEYAYDKQTNVATGFGTYRLIIRLPEQALEKTFAFRLPTIGTAFSMWINGEKVGQAGVPGKRAEESTPAYRASMVSWTPEKMDNEIVFHVSNFHHRSGGIWYAINFGPESIIHQQYEKNIFVIAFIIGALLIIAIYHFILFITRNKDFPSLFFALLCSTILIRLLFTEELLILSWFPNLPWKWLIRMEYLSLYMSVPSFVMFQVLLFVKRFKKTLIGIFWTVPVIFSLGVLLTQPLLFTQYIRPFMFFMGGGMVYFTIVLINCVRRKQEGALISLMGVLFFFLVVINDMLYSQLIVNNGYYTPLGLFVLVLSQSSVLSHLNLREQEISEYFSDYLEKQVNERLPL